MNLTLVAQDDRVSRLRCGGEVSHAYGAAEDHFVRLLGPSAYQQTVLVDFQTARYIDSSGLAWLLVAHKHFVERGGKLVVHSLPPIVADAIRLLRLDTVIKVAADEAAARAAAGVSA